jgi:hypothetical protein
VLRGIAQNRAAAGDWRLAQKVGFPEYREKNREICEIPALAAPFGVK